MQIGELARILDELKIERAQAEVDDRRARAEFADAVLAKPSMPRRPALPASAGFRAPPNCVTRSIARSAPFTRC